MEWANYTHIHISKAETHRINIEQIELLNLNYSLFPSLNWLLLEKILGTTWENFKVLPLISSPTNLEIQAVKVELFENCMGHLHPPRPWRIKAKMTVVFYYNIERNLQKIFQRNWKTRVQGHSKANFRRRGGGEGDENEKIIDGNLQFLPTLQNFFVKWNTWFTWRKKHNLWDSVTLP